MAAARITAMARQLLNASSLCAIATVAPASRAHVNTAYFAWNQDFDLIWLSEPGAKHSRNIRKNDTVAIAVYDSSQSWGTPDRGIQLFGTAREVEGADAQGPEALYAKRFPEYRQEDLGAFRFYVFRPRRLKLFDERTLGAGVFITASITSQRRLAWERTEIYRSAT